MTKPRYLIDSEILPAEYYEPIRKIFGNKKQVVSFKKEIEDEEFTKTELLLNNTELVKKCREWLQNTNAEVRNVYFRGCQLKTRPENPNKKLAVWLSKNGHTSQAVADAVGVSRITISRWVKSVRPRGRPGHFNREGRSDSEIGMLTFIGLDRLLEIKPVDGVDLITPADKDVVATQLAEAYNVPVKKLLARAVAAGAAVLSLTQDYKC